MRNILLFDFLGKIKIKQMSQEKQCTKIIFTDYSYQGIKLINSINNIRPRTAINIEDYAAHQKN